MYIINSYTLHQIMWMVLQKADKLFSAAKTGNAAETEKLVQSGVYVDYTNNKVSYVQYSSI